MLANLVTALRLRGKTHWRVAADCGLSPSQFSAVIGERKSVDPWLREKLAKLLNADPDWLFQSLSKIPSAVSGPETPASERASAIGQGVGHKSQDPTSDTGCLG
jgi:hypothetical protein